MGEFVGGRADFKAPFNGERPTIWRAIVGVADQSMRENRRYQRVRPSGLMAKTGKIISDPKAPAIDVSIIDLSAGGACLGLSTDVAVPKRFTLLHGATKKSCRLVWKRGYRLGVSF